MTARSPYPIVNGQKRCRCCRAWLDLDCYEVRVSRGKQYRRGACRSCQNLLDQAYRSRSPIKWSERCRNYRRAKVAADPDYYKKRYRRQLFKRAGLGVE